MSQQQTVHQSVAPQVTGLPRSDEEKRVLRIRGRVFSYPGPTLPEDLVGRSRKTRLADRPRWVSSPDTCRAPLAPVGAIPTALTGHQ